MSDPDDLSSPGAKGQLEREAAEWCVRMHGENAARERPAFDAWLRRGALHRETYNRIEEIYLLGSKVRRTAEEPVPERPTGPKARSPWRTAAPIASAAALALGAIGFMAQDHGRPSESHPRASSELVTVASAAAHFTTSNRVRDVALPDGSSVLLHPGADLIVAFDADRRRLRLVRGRARFDVAHEARDFIVTAGRGTVTAHGTSFEILVVPGKRVTVRLITGSVDVAVPTPGVPLTRASRQVGSLNPGQETTFADAPQGAAPGASREAEPQPRTVGELVEVANRSTGSRLKLVIADSSLLRVRLSGAFKVHDSEAVADRLAAMFDLQEDRSAPGKIILRRRSLGAK